MRLRILEYLDLHGECTVNTIVAGISGQQSAVSQHLNKMRMAASSPAAGRGRQILYRIGAVNAVTILNCLRGKYRSLQEE